MATDAGVLELTVTDEQARAAEPGAVQILQCLLHMLQLLRQFWVLTVLSAVPKANLIWGMCS